MHHPSAFAALAAVVLFASVDAIAQTTEPALPGKTQSTPIPPEFSDSETGRRLLHLSRFPTDYAGVIYFTYESFSPDGRLALIDAQYKDKWRHLYTFDFKEMKVRPLVTDRLTQNQVVATKSGNVYFMANDAAWVVPIAGGDPRKLADLPARWAPGIGFTVNADETLLLGGSTDTERGPDGKLPAGVPNDSANVLYTVDLKTGEVRVVHRDNKWFGHVQFSPTDPELLMFCWEGNWERVDRIWFIHPRKSTTDASGNVTSDARIAYKRTEPREIAGHEFWQPDGKAIWFQQSFRGRPGAPGFLTRMDVESGKTTQFTVPAGFGGIHETWSPDGTFMVADGTGRKGDLGRSPGKYLSKLTLPTDGSTTLVAEHLASFQANDYAIEPNPHVSPDNKWAIFTATLHGTPQAYAVELSPTPTTRPGN